MWSQSPLEPNDIECLDPAQCASEVSNPQDAPQRGISIFEEVKLVPRGKILIPRGAVSVLKWGLVLGNRVRTRVRDKGPKSEEAQDPVNQATAAQDYEEGRWGLSWCSRRAGSNRGTARRERGKVTICLMTWAKSRFTFNATQCIALTMSQTVHFVAVSR